MSVVSVCDINGTLVDALGEALGDVTCKFSIVSPPQSSGFYGIAHAAQDATTDATGYFSINLIRDEAYKVNIKDIGLYRAFTVPSDETSSDLFELLGFS